MGSLQKSNEQGTEIADDDQLVPLIENAERESVGDIFEHLREECAEQRQREALLELSNASLNSVILS
jgi:shikimate kinase